MLITIVLLVGGLEHFLNICWEFHHPNWLIIYEAKQMMKPPDQLGVAGNCCGWDKMARLLTVGCGDGTMAEPRIAGEMNIFSWDESIRCTKVHKWKVSHFLIERTFADWRFQGESPLPGQRLVWGLGPKFCIAAAVGSLHRPPRISPEEDYYLQLGLTWPSIRATHGWCCCRCAKDGAAPLPVWQPSDDSILSYGENFETPSNSWSWAGFLQEFFGHLKIVPQQMLGKARWFP